MKPNNTGSLPETVLQGETIQQDVADIITQATAAGWPADVMHQSMVASGVVLGVSKVQESFKDAATATVAILRSAIESIDKTILSCADTDSIEAMNELRHRFQRLLKQRADIVLGIFHDHIENEYGVSARTLAMEVEEDTDATNTRVGFVAYSKSPTYFAAWQTLKQANDIRTYGCQCSACLVAAAGSRMPESFKDLRDGIADAPSLDELFSEFGAFILGHLRMARDGIMEGTNLGVHTGSPSDDQVIDALKTFMSGLRGNL